MEATESLVGAWLLDGKGGGRPLDWQGVRAWKPADGFLWVHLDRTAPEAEAWMEKEAGLDALASEALLAEETRPRDLQMGDALLLILRGVNMNPGAEPDDMVAMRAWIEPHRAITLRARRLQSAGDIQESIRAGQGPRDAGSFLVELTRNITARMGPVVDNLEEGVDAIEEELIEAQSYELRTRIGFLRRQAIGLRRYMAPQREVMAHLQSDRLSWLGDLERARLRETADRLTRYVEELDAARDRAAVTQEELAGRLAEQMNRTMYILSIVACIFLPLGLLTGLLGINVGGIPGSEDPYAFLVVCAILLGIALVLILLFRRKQML